MNEYDLLAGLTALSVSRKGFGDRLKESASILRRLSGVDECSIYLWDAEREVYGIAARASAAKTQEGGVRVYAPEEGLIGAVTAGGKPVEARREGAGKPWDGARDRGLEGFAYAYLQPFAVEERPDGVLYLKSRDESGLSPEIKGLVSVAAVQIEVMLVLDRIGSEAAGTREELASLRGKLRNAEKFMALGDMAATLAHEIKNPLVSIGGFAERLKKKLDADSPALKYVELMFEEIKRLEKVTDGALRVLRKENLDLRKDDMGEIVESALQLFEEDFEAHKIKVIREYEHDRLPIMADRVQLKIAFDNLIANAIQSMDCGGILRLSTVSAGGDVVVEIADSGGGIDPEHLDNIFNPFFTTKEGGTGLGLPITYSIVTRHRGEIEVVNRQGDGVTFHIRIPLAQTEED